MRKIPVDELAIKIEEWKRLGIDARLSLIEWIHVEAHGMDNDPAREICIHTIHAYYDPKSEENVGIVEILRQPYDAGGYCLRPEVKERAETRSSPGELPDPGIGRMPWKKP